MLLLVIHHVASIGNGYDVYNIFPTLRSHILIVLSSLEVNM